MISGHHSHHCTYHHGDTLRCFLEENSFLWSPMGSMGLAQGPASRFSCASGRVCTACFFGWTRRQALSSLIGRETTSVLFVLCDIMLPIEKREHACKA